MWEKIRDYLSQDANLVHYMIGAFILLMLVVIMVLSGCSRDADIASQNLSYAADDFKVNRRIVFYNGITGEYMLTITGLCSLGNDLTPREVSITCKTGPDGYKKHFLGLSDNVTYFVEHIDQSSADVYHYDVVFRPSEIVPNIHMK